MKLTDEEMMEAWREAKKAKIKDAPWLLAEVEDDPFRYMDLRPYLDVFAQEMEDRWGGEDDG